LAVYQVFATSALVAFSGMVLLFLIGIFTRWTWIWPVSGIGAVFAVLLLALCVQAVYTPFTHGANDNATAAGLILTLAEHFRQMPLKNTRVWLVCTGSEEALHDGAIDFFRRHKSELTNPKAVVLESLGYAGPSWLVGEGIVLPILPDTNLVDLAEEVSKAHPELGAYPSRVSGGVTEMSDAIRAGVPAITIMGLTRENILPYWHQTADTVDKIDPAVLKRNYAFTWNYIQTLDEQGT
jgi:Zn-dependent M28 family amino/carboxypeptidase